MFEPQPLQIYLDALGDEIIQVSGDTNVIVRGATSDSRNINAGWLFVAIQGANVDGAAFIPDALQFGASAIVTDRTLQLPAAVCNIQVENTYKAAGRIAEAAYGYPARSLHTVGITGTNGKTTCAYLLRDIMRQTGVTTGMIGTVQYEVGDHVYEADRTTPTPFELQKMLVQMKEAGVYYLVMEVSSHALHQRRPGQTPFCAGLFTNLTGDHCDYHETMENYFAAKSILFEEYLADGAPAVINADDPYGQRLLEAARRNNSTIRPISFGTDERADVRITEFTSDLQGVKLVLKLNGSELHLQAPVMGRFSVYNIAGAVSVALALGFSTTGIQKAVSNFHGAPGRLQPIQGRDNIQALVDYAHTDDALENVLETLKALQPARLFVVFGCGGDRDRTKRPRMGAIAARLADRVFVTSDNPRSEDPQAIIEDIVAGIPDSADIIAIPDRRQAIQRAIKEAIPGTLILVAGKGHETYQNIKGKKYPFNDAMEIDRAMRDRGLR